MAPKNERGLNVCQPATPWPPRPSRSKTLGVRLALPCVLAALSLITPRPSAATEPAPLEVRLDQLRPEQLDTIAKADARQLVVLAGGVRRALSSLARERALFQRSDQEALTADERATALDLFAEILSYQVALDTLARFHLDFYRLDLIRNPVPHARHFLLGFTAYYLQVRLGLELIDRTSGKPQFEALLDEGSPERGVPPKAYARLKWNVVHLQELGRIFAAHQYHKFLSATLYRKLGRDPALLALQKILDDSYRATKQRLQLSGAKLFASNGLDVLKDGGHGAWFPVQARVAEWLGDTRVHRIERDLIDAAEIVAAATQSRPGDIVVERRNWYLSNVGLPGFWPHAALYLGSPQELAAFLDGDDEVKAAYRGSFTRFLAKREARAWKRFTAGEHGHPYRLIEAMSEGVVFTTIEHSFSADYAAALRPRLSKLEIARAIERAFGYAGRPYDFDFDFQTDRALVCSELVYKAYEPRKGVTGLRLTLDRVLGRPTLPPNTMIAQFDRELGQPGQQLDFVWFLDGREREKKSVWSTQEALRTSHRRPKWDIAQQ